MKTLESIGRFLVPASIAEETDRHLRNAGTKHAECFVLWSGVEDGGAFQVRTLHVPRQTAYTLPEGVCVRVDGDELHRLNVWLFGKHETLAVQVHSHPTAAFHSETDDTYPIATLRGALSIVVPNFGHDGIRGAGVAYYRLSATGWNELHREEAERLIRYEE